MNSESVSFVIDPTLGKLAKWLRIMGFDAHYQTSYNNMEIGIHIKDGRTLLTRNMVLMISHKPSFMIHSDKVQDQLIEMKKYGFLPVAYNEWFRRCIKCNIPLMSVQLEDARGRIPEHVLSQNTGGVKFCPSCKRYLWPGSHRVNMLNQIKNWGL